MLFNWSVIAKNELMKVRVNKKCFKLNLQNKGVKIYEKRIKILVENFVILIKSSTEIKQRYFEKKLVFL